MDTVFKSLYFREPVLHYVCPPICENIFSSSGGPVIVLNAKDHLGPVTGLVMGGVGDFHLRWSVYPGAVCYTVYMSPEKDGTYIIVAECIPDPEFDVSDIPDGTWIVITAITPEGETPFGEPIEVVKVPAQCPHIDAPLPELDVVAAFLDDVVLGPFAVNEGIGFGVVNYLWFKDGLFFEDTTYTTQGALSLPEVTAEDEGVYHLELTNNNPDCTVVSDSITLMICPYIEPPAPESTVNAFVDGDADLGPFNVNEASCVGGVTYVWYKDAILYEDTTATTQGALAISNAQESDSGEYTLHLGCESLGCDELISDPITLNVSACGDMAQALADVEWTETPTPSAECVSATLTTYGSPPPDQMGTWSMTFSGTCGSNVNTVLEGYLCNNTESDIFVSVVMQVTSKTGTVGLWTLVQVVAYVDEAYADAGNFVTEPAINDSRSVLFTLSPGPHKIQLVFAGQVSPSPTFTIGGNISALVV